MERIKVLKREGINIKLSKTRRVVFSLFLLLMSLVNFCSTDVQAAVSPATSYYVTDTSNVLKDDVEKHILDINYLFEKTEEQPQVAVVTIPTLDGIDIETYAVEQFETMGIGNADYDNGVLILLATEDREIRVEIGYGLEGALPDGKVGRIIDASISNLASGNYSQAIQDIFNQIVLSIQEEYAYEDVFNGTVPIVSDQSGNIEPYIIILIIVGIVIYLLICKVIGINPLDALILLMNVLSSASSNCLSSSSHHSSGGGGLSGGGGASRDF